MSVRLAYRSFQHPVGIAENMLVEVVIQVKQKQLNLGVGTERMIFNIDSAMKHSYSNDDTCFSIDVIDEILEEDFDALLNEGGKILHSIKGILLEKEIFAEFDEFMAMIANENSDSDTEELPFEKITISTDYEIKTSLEKPPMDLKLKPLPDNLEYVFLEEPSFLPEKCHFMVKEGIVLGHKVSSAGLEVEKSKNRHFSKMARPLTKLLEKDIPFEFDDECQKAFELLKEKLTFALVIVSPNWNLPFELMCDASDFAVGAVLGQKDDNPAIWSRKLDDALWAFRTAYKTPTGTTPYKLIYGKNCHLPFKIEHHAYWAIKNCNPDLIAAGEKRMFQLHELDELRHQAYENSCTLLMALLNEHQLKFNSYKSAKSLMEAIGKRFREGLDQIYDRLQKLISQLEIHGETISQEDLNMNTNEAVKTAHGGSAANSKTNASTLPSVDSLSDAEMDLKWQMTMLTMRARRFLKKIGRNIGVNGTDTIGFDKTKAEEGPTNFVLMTYTSLGSSSFSNSDTQVSTCSKSCLKSYETLKEHYDNLTKDFNKSQLNVGAYKAGLELVEARLDVYKKNEAIFEEDIKILKLDILLRDNALTELRKKFEKAKKERDDLKLTLEKFENSSKNLSKLLDIQVSDKFKTGVRYDSQVFDSQENDKYKTSEGYHVVPPPYTRNFMPPKPDLVLADEDEYVFSESVTSVPDIVTSKAKTSKSKPKSVSEPLIEDWISNSEDENKT
ncbi:reverse transcriptase domain-containing protein [Tanacetum coccineum]